jgi:hypothetical protein
MSFRLFSPRIAHVASAQNKLQLNQDYESNPVMDYNNNPIPFSKGQGLLKEWN